MIISNLYVSFVLITSNCFLQTNAQFVTCKNEKACSSTAQDSDFCCVQKMGLAVLSLQWIDNLGPIDKFTIHGLWPNNCDGTYGPDIGCDSKRTYDLSRYLPNNPKLLNQMKELWPSYKNDYFAFWKHEWDKHGTCISTIEPKCYSKYSEGQDMIDYFNTTIKLAKMFDLYQVLLKEGIRPGQKYKFDQVYSSLFNQYRTKIHINCKNEDIQEIQIGLYGIGKYDFSVVNSTGIKNLSGNNPSTNCPNIVNYPKKLVAAKSSCINKLDLVKGLFRYGLVQLFKHLL